MISIWHKYSLKLGSLLPGEGLVQLLGQHRHPRLVRRGEPARRAAGRHDDPLAADGRHHHGLRVVWQVRRELHAAGEQDEVGQVVAAARLHAAPADLPQGRRVVGAQGLRALRHHAGLHDAAALVEDGDGAGGGGRAQGVPGPRQFPGHGGGQRRVDEAHAPVGAGVPPVEHHLVGGLGLQGHPGQAGEDEAAGHGQADDVGAGLRAAGVGHGRDAGQDAVEEQREHGAAAHPQGRRARRAVVGRHPVGVHVIGFGGLVGRRRCSGCRRRQAPPPYPSAAAAAAAAPEGMALMLCTS
mmetsp:Transcript_38110/g.94508  ORF Transcript_38110/g.94508 Transcript_38110/m.94508 type:complete len:297 (-) Transcript_38110:147-1037(-)